jgi:hypothetical protein
MAIALSLFTVFSLLLVLVLGAGALAMRRRIAMERRLLGAASRLGLEEDQTEALLDAASPPSLARALSEAAWTGLFVAGFGILAVFAGRALYAGQLAVGLWLGGFICMAMGAGLIVMGLAARFWLGAGGHQKGPR